MKDVSVAMKTPSRNIGLLVPGTWYIVFVVQLKCDCIRDLILVLLYTKVVRDLCTTFLRAPQKTILTSTHFAARVPLYGRTTGILEIFCTANNQ